MGKKQLKSLLILLVVMVAVAAALKMTQTGQVEKSRSINERDELIADFPINDVAEVKIETADESVTLKQGKSGWQVSERGAYAAKSDQVVKFLRLIWGLKIVQNVQVGESQYGRLHLLPKEEGKEKKKGEVEKTIYFKDKEGKILSTLYLGKDYERMENRPSPFGGGPSMSKIGRYVKTADDDGVFLVGETFATADTDPSKWLDEEFFKIENIKAVEIKSGNKAEDWKLSRDKPDGEFVLAGAKKDEKYDATRANAMKSAFSSPRFEDVLIGQAAAEKPNKTTFQIDTFAGFHYVVKVGKKNDLNEYLLTVDVTAKLDEKRAAVKDESEEDKKKNDEAFTTAVKAQKEKLTFEKSLSGKVFKVRSYVVDSINKKRADLMKQDKPAAGGQPGGMPGMPAGFPGGGGGFSGGGGAGGIPPEMLQKILSGAKMPGGHPPVKQATQPAPATPMPKAKAGKPAAKKVETKKVQENVKADGDKKTATEAPKPAAKPAAKKAEKNPAKPEQAAPQAGKPAGGEKSGKAPAAK